MSTSRLADRQIRAAASQAALRLDVRGPVSKALGNTGITVTPADLEGADLDAPVLEGEVLPIDREPAPRVRPRGLRPTHKPFKDDPWPTRSATSRPPEPQTLSGLTVDERRVHRILLDTLARENTTNAWGSGLTFAEKRHLPTLDLDFIDSELAKLRRSESSKKMVIGIAIGVVLAVGLPFALIQAFSPGGDRTFLYLFILAGTLLGLVPGLTDRRADGQRLKIYEALRELALLVDDTPVSAALDRADSLIDHFADADEASSSGTTRRIRTHS